MDINFPSTEKPELITIQTFLGDSPLPLVMNPGRWTVSIQTDQNLYLVCNFITWIAILNLSNGSLINIPGTD